MKTKVLCLLIVGVCVVSAGSAFAAGVEIKASSGLIGRWTSTAASAIRATEMHGTNWTLRTAAAVFSKSRMCC